MCQRCGKDFPHPHQHANSTNSIKRHYKANKCQCTGNNTLKQQNIQQSMKFIVYYIISYNLYLYTNLYQLGSYFFTEDIQWRELGTEVNYISH
jgi:hypothetical protein